MPTPRHQRRHPKPDRRRALELLADADPGAFAGGREPRPARCNLAHGERTVCAAKAYAL
jgi:hypothetical protein